MGLNCSCFVVASYCILTCCGTSNTLAFLVDLDCSCRDTNFFKEMSMYEYAGLVDADLCLHAGKQENKKGNTLAKMQS